MFFLQRQVRQLLLLGPTVNERIPTSQMPGTIQVSVLDVDLPSSYSSSFSSSISIKVSLGKREYQTLGKGDFFFPLTNFRDNLILTLLDADGNELSRTVGVETMSVVEKGIWDDLFPLEGGGHLRMKLQLILSDEERKRVREMREFAMKKKHEEDNSSHRQLETPAAPDAIVGVNVAPPSLSLKHEVAETPAQNKDLNIGKRYIQGFSISNPVSHSNNPQFCSNKGRTPLDQLEKTAPDGGEANPSKAPLSQELNVLDPIKAYCTNLDGKFEIHLPPADVPVKPNASLEAIDSQLGSSESSVTKTNSVPAIMRKDEIHSPEDTALERTPSSIRNLISAFESSLPQEVGAHGNAPTTRSQSRKTGLQCQGLFETETIREKTKSTQNISAKQSNSLSRARFWEARQQSPKHTTKQGEQIGLDVQIAHGPSEKLLSQNPGQLVVLSSKNTLADQMKSGRIINSTGVGKLEHRHDENESLENFTRPSIKEISTVSGRMFDGPLATNEPFALCSDQRDFALGFVLEDNGCRNYIENSDKLNFFDTSNIWNISVAHESLGSWILADGSRHLCITTGSKQVMDLMGSWGVRRETHERDMSVFKMDAFDEVLNCMVSLHFPNDWCFNSSITTIRYSNEVTNLLTQSLSVILSGISIITVTSLLISTSIHAFVLQDLFTNDIAIAIKTSKKPVHRRSGSHDAKDNKTNLNQGTQIVKTLKPL